MWTAREHQDSPTRELDTPFGRMIAVVTDCDHIYLKPAVEDGVSLRVNRVDMHATMHLRNYGDGKGFSPDQGEDRTRHGIWNSVCTSRPDQTDVSFAAKEKIWRTLPCVVNEWLEGQSGLLKDARRVELNNAIIRKREEKQELLDKTNDLNNELEELYDAERKLRSDSPTS